MNRLILVTPLMASMLSSMAHAHPGPRVWISIDGATIVTYGGDYPPGNPGDYQPSRVFTGMLVDEDDVWSTEFPGYQKVPGGTIPNETTFSYNITGPLLWYNPGGGNPFFETVTEHFVSLPPIPQMAVTNNVFQTKVTASGFVMGNSTFTYHGDDNDHAHLTYTLFGNGTMAGGGPNGIYALPLQLIASGATASETYYIVLGKNVSQAELDAAADLLLSKGVPAVSEWGMLVVALTMITIATIVIRNRRCEADENA